MVLKSLTMVREVHDILDRYALLPIKAIKFLRACPLLR